MKRRCHIKAGLVIVGCLMAFQPAGTMGAEPTTKTRAMREVVYERLSRAQEAVEAGDWQKAYDQLRRCEKMKDLAPHEKAQLYTAYGYTYFSQEKYAESAAAYQKVLQQEDLSEAMRTSTLFTLGQLEFHLERYDAAVGHLEKWLQVAENPGPDPFILMGQALYQLGRLDEAAAPVERAITIARQRDQKVQESWYALLRVIYYETRKYDQLVDVLETLVTEYPAKEYWIHLAAAYGEMGQTRQQLATYELAYAQGYLSSSAEIVLLSQLLLQAEIPYRAGVLLQKGLEDGTVASTADNWRLLSQAWSLAQEYDAAIVSLSQAAKMSDDGELYARIAQSHANLNQWEESIAAARTALAKGVKSPQELQLMQGMAFFELGRFAEAKSAFTAAAQTKQGRDTATRWLAYVEREEARLKELGLQP